MALKATPEQPGAPTRHAHAPATPRTRHHITDTRTTSAKDATYPIAGPADMAKLPRGFLHQLAADEGKGSTGRPVTWPDPVEHERENPRARHREGVACIFGPGSGPDPPAFRLWTSN